MAAAGYIRYNASPVGAGHLRAGPSFVTVTPHNPRAMQAEKLKDILSVYGMPVTACAEIPEGVAEAIRQAGPEGVVCALGSLYFSGDIREAVIALKI